MADLVNVGPFAFLSQKSPISILTLKTEVSHLVGSYSLLLKISKTNSKSCLNLVKTFFTVWSIDSDNICRRLAVKSYAL